MTKLNILIGTETNVVSTELENKFRELNYLAKLHHVSSVKALLTFVEEITPDLVVIAVSLKGEPGVVAAAQQIYDKHKIPVIFVSSGSPQQVLDKTIFYLKALSAFRPAASE